MQNQNLSNKNCNNPIAEELIQNLYDYYQEVPQSAEKNFIYLEYLSTLLNLNPEKINQESHYFKETTIKAEIDHTLQTALRHAQEEDIITSKLKKEIEEFKSHIQSNSWEEAALNMKRALKASRPLDLREINRLCMKSDESSAKLNDKNCALFIGSTGVGKSTSALFLAGCPMEKTVHDGKFSHIKPKSYPSKELESIQTRPDVKSVTRYVSIVPVQVKDKDKFGYAQDQILYLCDTPGLGDTEGVEVEIANTYSIINAAKSAKSVRLVLVVSHTSKGDRWERLSSLCETIINMLKNQDTIIGTLSILFTKWPENEKNEISAYIKKLIEEEEKRDRDSLLVSILKIIAGSFDEKPIVIDPLQPNEIPEILKRITATKKIMNPDAHFNFFISDLATNVLYEHFYSELNSIKVLIRSSKFDYICYKMKYLKFISELTNIDKINKRYEEIKTYLAEEIKRHIENSKDTIIKKIHQGQLIDKMDLELFSKSLNHARDAETLRKEFLNVKELKSSTEYENDLIQEIFNLDFSNSLSTWEEINKQNNTCKNLEFLASIYEKLKQLINDLVNTTIEKIEEYKQNFLKNFDEKNYESCNREFKIFEMTEKLLSQTFKARPESPQLMLNKIRKIFQDKLDLIQNTEEKSLEELDTIYKSFLDLKEEYFFKSIYSDIETLFKDFVDNLVQKLETENKFLSGLDEHNSDAIEKLVEKIQQLQKFPILSSKLTLLYLEIINTSAQTVINQKLTLKSYLDSNCKIPYIDLKNGLHTLNKFKWISKYKSGVYENVLSNVSNKILNHAEALKQSMMSIKLNINYPERHKEYYRLLMELKKMGILDADIPALKDIIKDAEETYKARADHFLAQINSKLDISKLITYELDYELVENSLKYYKEIEEINLIDLGDNTDFSNSLDQYIKAYINSYKVEISGKFNNFFKDIVEQVKIPEEKIEYKKITEAIKFLIIYHEIIKSLEEKKFPILSAYFSEWNSTDLFLKLHEIYSTIEAECKKRFNALMKLTSLLGLLDKIMPGTSQFKKLNKKIEDQAKDLKEELIEYIKAHMFEEAAQKITTVSEDDYKAAFKIIINQEIPKFMAEADKTVHNFIEDASNKNLKEYLLFYQKYVSLSTHLIDFVNDKEKLEETIKNYIGTLINYIENQYKEIESNSEIIEIEQMYKSQSSLKNTVAVAKRYIPQEIQDKVKNLFQLIDEKVRKFTTELTNQEAYEMILSGKPKAIYEILEKQTNMSKVLSELGSKLRNLIDSKEKQIDNGDTNIINKKRDMMEWLEMIEFLPESLKKIYQARFEEKKKKIEKESHEYSEGLKILETEAASDRTWIKSAQGILEKKLSQEEKVKIDNILQKKFSEFASKITSSIEGYEFNESLISDFSLAFDSLSPYLEIKEEFKIVKDLVFRQVRMALSELDSLNKNSALKIEKKIDFVKSYQRLIIKRSSLNFKDPDLNQNIEKSFNLFIDNLKKAEESLLKAINEKKNDDIFHYYNYFKTGEPIFAKIQSDSNSENSLNLKSIKENIKSAIMNLTIYQQNLSLSNSETNENAVRRRAFYERIASELKFLEDITKQFSKNELEIGDSRGPIERLNSRYIELTDFVKRNTHELLSNSYTNVDFCRSYNTKLENINVLHEILGSWIRIDASILEDTSFECSSYLKKSLQNVDKKELDAFSKELMKSKVLQVNIPYYSGLFFSHIEESVEELINYGSLHVIGTLGAILNKDNLIGQLIITQHSAFQGYSRYLFNNKTKLHGIEYVTKNIEGSPNKINTKSIEKNYEEFDLQYKKLIENAVANVSKKKGPGLEELKAKFNLYRTNDWSEVYNNLNSILAILFAYLSIKNSKDLFDDNATGSLFQPHPAQIAALYRIFGVGDSPNLKNHFVQILTGEGKSIILAVASTIFAMANFKVNCICYSNYLSTRDYASFVEFFKFFSVADSIEYGTINEICEKFTNRYQDVRSTVEKIVLQNQYPIQIVQERADKKNIILVDEVDVFFNPSFYGSLFRITSNIRHPKIAQMTDFIWSNRAQSSKDLIGIAQNSSIYQELITEFKDWEQLIADAVRMMIQAVKNFKVPEYKIKDDKVAYIDIDTVSSKVSYGYRTMFAYYDAFHSNKISQKSFEDNRYLKILCGDYSYCEVLKEFDYIFGVSGTLKSLNSLQKNIIESNYNIRDFTFLPSIYGKNQLEYSEYRDVRVVDNEDFFKEIRFEINKILSESKGKRSVLVFFDTIKSLYDFKSSEFGNFSQHHVEVLTEELTVKEKTDKIAVATSSGKVTLCTQVYGRGTDFICRDQTVNNNGGVHVIQTYVSVSHSDETQVKGRTSRQGEKGSYSMVLSNKVLDQLHITYEQLRRANPIYNLINDRRNRNYEDIFKDNIKFATEVEPLHRKSKTFIEALLQGEKTFIKTFLIEENKNSESIIASRTIVLMDATGSMSNLIHKAKNSVKLMFDRANNILVKNKVYKGFELQFAVYRNYNAPFEKLYQSSGFESDPMTLRTFIDGISAEYGQGNEAIEVGLHYSLKEAEQERGLNQVILIGDMPPNTLDNIEENRKQRMNQWIAQGVDKIPHYLEILNKYKAKKIPIHGFYVKNTAMAAFQEIAQATEGHSDFLDVNDEERGSEMLTNLATKSILESIGGEVLIKAYEKEYENKESKGLNCVAK